MRHDDEQPKPTKTKGSRYASKKNYFARNVGGAISNRHKATRKAAAEKRKAYWATEVGQARRSAKMNTEAKLAKREASLQARNKRRLHRRLENQKIAELAKSAVNQEV